MQMKSTKPKSLIFYYCSICVLIGCVETSINQKMFERNHKPIVPLRTITIRPVPKKPAKPLQTQFEWEGCPNKENVSAAIDECNKFIADTRKLVVAFQNEGDAEENKFKTKLDLWHDEALAWRIKSKSRLRSCELLLGATGVLVHPELPLALENLKRAGGWLDLSVAAAQAGNLIDAVDYISYARKATLQAGKLVNGRVRPNARTALVGLPKRLQALAVSHKGV